jgi:hypothetical protein
MRNALEVMRQRPITAVLIDGPYQTAQFDLPEPRTVRLGIPPNPDQSPAPDGVWYPGEVQYDVTLDETGFPSRDEQGRVRYHFIGIAEGVNPWA